MAMLKKIPGYYVVKKYVRNHTRFDKDLNFLLFADPRGGSTWFSECLVSILNKPLIWEPLHLKRVEELKPLKFGWRQYVGEDCSEIEIKNFFSKLFEGRLKSDWLYNHTSLWKLYTSNSAIFKFCRGNQLLPYLVEVFDLKYKPIYFIRHPFAVVASQLKQGGWSNTSTGFSSNEIDHDPLKRRHREFLLSLTTKEEVLTANWCIVNKVPLEHKLNNIKWITITYEEFLQDPEKTFRRIQKEWNKNLDTTKVDFNKNSVTSIEEVTTESKLQLAKWKNQLSELQIWRMLKVLRYFDIEIYSEDALPHQRFNL
ncbi:hypothetical protein BST97_00105 [Nonlabens spongiae]|uniref:Sulfotransferase domain-containing protein n=1 Tax=Nonlabens spongiae TaxID=331648 RepID=A0A1W6MFZ9_9FLAO|nr:hypothetical protein [Nonlabens spongiae]ARN76531.1 hypothetical protein BST97_00105 [Nonlabens spongiae]